MKLISKITISIGLFMLLTVAAANAQDIHVYATGSSPYIGSTGLKQAILDSADPGTIYVHSGVYDFGATSTSFLTITKSVSLIGHDDGSGKPLIKGARPSGSPGLVLVNAPNKVVVLENLAFSFYGVRGVGSNDTAVAVVGSDSFTVRNCVITSAYFDGTNNTGLASAISIAGPARSELDPMNPAYASRFNVKGEIKIQDSMLTSWINTIGIGFFGPVSLDSIEVSNCTLKSLGSTQLGEWAKGNFGIVISQYPFYMNDANRSLLVEATHAATQTTIRNNTITAPNALWFLYLKGVQRLEKNRLNSFGSWYSAGKYYQAAIAAFGYPHDISDPSTYSEAIISDNVIELRVPAFPIIPGIPFAPPQTTNNTSPPVGIWLGVSGRLFFNSAITGHHAKATVTDNVFSSNAFSIPSQINDPDYGIYLTSEMNDCLVSGNQLAGGMLRDPIDGRASLFRSLTAKVSQLYVDAEVHNNTIHRNTFGFAGIAGVLCHGHDNWFENNHFIGNYVGWEPGPGLFWLKSASFANLIVATKLNAPPFGFSICQQIRDENGMNNIPGFERCGQ